MRLDGLTLGALADEVGTRASGLRVEKISSLGHRAVVLDLKQGLQLLISASPKGARVVLRPRPKTTRGEATAFAMVLRKHLEGGRLVTASRRPSENSVEVLFYGWDDDAGERPKKITLEALGARSNVFFLDYEGTIIDTMRKAGDRQKSARPDMPGEKYVPMDGFHMPEALHCTKEAFVASALRFRSAHPTSSDAAAIAGGLFGLSEAHAGDLIYGLAAGTLEDLAGSACERLHALKRENAGKAWPAVVTGEGKNRRVSLVLRDNGGSMPAGEAVELLFKGLEKEEEADIRKASLSRLVSTALGRAQGKLGTRAQELAQASSAERYKSLADAILASPHLLPKEADGRLRETAFLPDYSAEGAPQIEVKIDRALSPARNAARYYAMYSRAKRAAGVLKDLIIAAEAEVEYLAGVKDALLRANDPVVIEQVRDELATAGYIRRAGSSKGSMRKLASKQGGNSKKTGTKPPLPAEYTLSTGHKALVGRNNSQNEALTFTIASPWDIWLHVKGAPGSHVVIRRQRGEALPEAAFDEAAKLALENSSLAHQGRGEVDITEIRRVRKIKGGLPGAVTFTDQRTVSVRL